MSLNQEIFNKDNYSKCNQKFKEMKERKSNDEIINYNLIITTNNNSIKNSMNKSYYSNFNTMKSSNYDNNNEMNLIKNIQTGQRFRKVKEINSINNNNFQKPESIIEKIVNSPSPNRRNKLNISPEYKRDFKSKNFIRKLFKI